MDIKLRGILYIRSDILSRHIKDRITRNKYNLLFQQFYEIGNKLTVTYNDQKYIFEEIMDDDYYILFSKDDKDDRVMVVISKKEKTAEIHGLGKYTSCIMHTNENVDSILLHITIKMLRKYKYIFGIEMIILADNSLKKCHDYNIKLTNMLTLLTGNTWFGEYGFRPIELSNNKYIINEYSSQLYEKNKQIIDNLKIGDFDLIKYIIMSENEELINTTKQIIKQKPNMLLKDYLTNILKKYDETCQENSEDFPRKNYFINKSEDFFDNEKCENFNKFYMELYDDIGLYNFHKQLFGLVI